MKISELQKEYGFWRQDEDKNFPPKSIIYPHEYKGEKSISIFCSQHIDLTPSQQKKIIKEWVIFLPTCTNLEFVWFPCRVSQDIFNSVCELENLNGLYIKWSGIKYLDNITKLKNLQYLYIGTSGSIESIIPLQSLNQLEVLSLNALKKITDFSPLSKLTSLKFLSIEGSMISTQKIESIKWITPLNKLIFLSLVATKLIDRNMSSLYLLKQLETLNLPLLLTDEETEQLELKLPKLKYLPSRYIKENMEKIKNVNK